MTKEKTNLIKTLKDENLRAETHKYTQNLLNNHKNRSLTVPIKNNKKDYQISTKGSCFDIIQTKDNEICYYEYKDGNETICFYDLLERKVKSSISNISCWNMIMMTKDLLLITGENKISIINVNNYKLRIINVPGSGYIRGLCILNQNMLLTGDESSSKK